MSFIKFSDWIVARESSPFTRLRRASAFGLMPPIPDASVNSHSTATPFEQKKLLKKKKRKAKGSKKKKIIKNAKIDSFVNSVEDLEKDLELLDKLNKLQPIEAKNTQIGQVK